MSQFFSSNSTQHFINLFFRRHALSQFISAFMGELMRVSKMVNRRALSAISTTIVLSALLTACGGGGGGGGDDASGGDGGSTPTTPTLTVLSNSQNLTEGFTGSITIANATNADRITFTQSNPGVVTISATNARVSVSSVANARGRTTITITAFNGSLSSPPQVVVVEVTPATPTLTVLSNNQNLTEDFTGSITLANATNADRITFTQSNPGVVTITASNTGVSISSIANASGRTTITITAFNGPLSSLPQVVVVEVTPATPTVTVLSNSHNLTEGFTGSINIATITNADRITVTQSNPGVINITASNASVSISSIANARGQTTITITAFNGSLSSPPQEVAVQITRLVLNTTPTLTVLSNSHNLTENFSGSITIATAANADRIAVTQSNTGVVSITTSNSSVSISNIANARGRTTITITAFNGPLSSLPQVVVVEVTPATPTVTVLGNSHNLTENFSGSINIANATNADRITVTQSNPGVISITTSNASVSISSIANVHGRTTITITAFNGPLSSLPQVVVVEVTPATPTVTVLSNSHNLTEGFTGSIAIANATNADRITVTQSNPGVVSITTSNASVSISNIANASGRTTITITAFNGPLSSLPQVVVVEVTPATPTVTVLGNSHNLTEGFTGSIAIANAANADRITVTQSNTGVVSITTSNSSVSISSIANVHGRTTITITAFNGSLSSLPQVVVVEVTPTTPTVTVLGNSHNLTEGFTGSIAIANAANADRITVTQSNPGVVSITTSNASVSISSIANASGRTTITITAFNGSLSSLPQVVVVEVTPATPTLTVLSNSHNLTEGFTGSIAIANATNADRITVTQSNTGVVSITTSNSSVSISSIANVHGRTTITITAFNGSLSSLPQVVVVEVTPTTPTLTVLSNSQNLTEGFTGSIAIANATNADRITVTQSNPGVINITTSNASVSISNIANVHGRTTITITAFNGPLSSLPQVVVVEVTPATPTVTVLGNSHNLKEGFTGSIAIANATNADRITVTQSNPGVVSITTSNASVSISNIANASGRTTITITAFNGPLNSLPQVVVVEVTPATPTVTVLSNSHNLTENFSGSITIATAANADRITVTQSNLAVVNITTSNTGVSISNIANASGRTTITITASNGSLSSLPQVVVVEVTPATPTVTVLSNNHNLTEGFTGSIAIATAANADRITVTQSNPGVVNITTSNTSVSISRIANASGRTTITITASNGSLSSPPQEVVVQITRLVLNTTPTLTVLSNSHNLTENFSGSITIATAANADRIAVTQSNSGVISITTSNASVSISSIANARGRTTITITAFNGPLSSLPQVVVVEVTPATPTVTVLSNSQNLTEGFTGSINIANATNADRITVTQSNTGVVSITTSNSSVSISSIANVHGRTTITITAFNGSLSSLPQVVVVEVTPTTPTLTVLSNSHNLTEGFTGSIAIANATNADRITVTQTNPGVINITTSNASVSISNIANVHGRTTITITAFNGPLSSLPQVVVVEVTPATPTVTVLGNSHNLTEGFTGSIAIANATNADRITVTQSNPGVVSITTSNANVSISSIANVHGRTTITITAFNGPLSSLPQVVVVEVTPTTPTVTALGNSHNLKEGFTGSITIANATNADRITVTQSNPGVVSITTSNASVSISSIANVHGRTTITITAFNGPLSSLPQVVVVEVTPPTPTLTVLSNSHNLTEGFTGSIAIANATNADRITVTQSNTGVVSITTSNASVSISSIANASGRTTITITAFNGPLSSLPQVVVVVVNPPTPTLTVLSNSHNLTENFSGSITIANATNADRITVTQSNLAVVNITTSNTGVSISNIANASGRTTITITAFNGSLSSLPQVVVVVVNPPTPTLTVLSNSHNLTENFSGSITIANATNADRITVTQSNPGVVSITTSNASISISNIANASGRTTITITAFNGSLSSLPQVVVVEVTPATPTVTVLSNNQNLTEGFTGSIAIATITNADRITVTQSNPGVVNITTSNTGVSISNIASARGRTTITITAFNGSLSSLPQMVMVVVNPATPTVTVLGNSQNLTENFLGPITIANATNADRITVTQSNPGVVSITTSNASVGISNIANARGRTTITITAFNGSLSSLPQMVVVEVTPATPTVTVLSNSHNLTENFPGPITIATAANADRITVTQSNTGVVSITTSNASVSISNIATVHGRTTITITAFNGPLSSLPQVVVVEVTPTTTPTLTVVSNNQNFTENFPGPIIIAIAANADQITVTQSNPTVVSITTSNTSVSISNIANVHGRTTITITAFNGSLSSPPQVVVVEITPATPTVTVLSTNHKLKEGFTGSINIANATNADRITVTQSNTGVVSITTSNASVSISNIANARGRTTLTITAFNGPLSSLPQVVVVELTPPTTPTLTVLSNNHNLTEGFSGSIAIATATNADRITVTQSNTGVVSITITSARVSISSLPNGIGRTTITITAMNGSLSISPQVVVVQVTSLNPIIMPTLSVLINSYNLQEDFMGSINIATAVNADRTIVTQSQAGVVNITTSASNVRISSLPNVSGRTILTITAFNGSLGSSNEIVVVNVSAVNDLPIISLSTESITVFGGFSPITIGTTITDADHNVNFSYTIQDANPGLVSAMISPNAITLNAIPGASGTTTLTVRSSADPSGGIGTRTISVVVINSSPVVNVSTSLILVQEDFSNPIVVRTTITDAEPGTLSITVTSATSIVNAVVSPPINNVRNITLTPVAHAYGRTTFTVQATDVGGKTASSEFVVEISAVNDTPTLSVSQNSILRTGAFTPITIHTTASDVEDSVLSLDVQESTTGVIQVSTTTNSIILRAIPGGSGQTTLTVRVVDSSGSTALQTITVNINIVTSGSRPVLQVSTTHISLQEDFGVPFVINTTETDADGDGLTFSLTSTTYLVDAVISTLSSDRRTITLMPVANAHGTSTLFVQTADPGGLIDSTEIVVVVNPVNDPVRLSLPVAFLSTSSVQASYRNIYSVNINHIDNDPIEAQMQVTIDTPDLFSANPAPVVSFTTHTLTTTAVLNSGSTTAHLYFTIRPNQASIATLTIQLNNLTRSEMTQQIFVVQSFSRDVPPAIIRENTNLRNLVADNGRLYANSTITSQAIAPFLAQASALGGHLVNINTVEEFNFLRSSGFVTNEAWYGLVLPKLDLPGELFWRTNNSTLAYGFVSTSANTTGNISVYPGIYPLAWEDTSGLIANRPSSLPSTFNWTVYNQSVLDRFFLLGDGGDTRGRSALYEFPQGLTPTSNPPVVITAGVAVTVRLTGYDLNGGSISTANWSSTSTAGSHSFTHVSATTGVQTVDFNFKSSSGFNGEITINVTLTVNGQTTTIPLRFFTVVPTFTLSTNHITLTENSSQTIRHQLAITNISIPALAGTTRTEDLVWQFSGVGSDFFSNLPAFNVSFSTNAIVQTASIGSAPQTAQLYFSIAPDQSGTQFIGIQLTDRANSIRSVLQTLTVQVNPVAEPPTIVQTSPNLQNLVVHGGHLYANSTTPSQAITPFLPQARALGGHLVNINTEEEFTFLRSGAGGINISETWIGLVLPQRHFPGELFWVTNDSTIVYGYASTDTEINYPGHFSLSWIAPGAVRANRTGSAATLFNWTIYSPGVSSFFLLDDIGDRDRFALYEFPQGLPVTPIQMDVTSTVTVQLTGFDLDGDAITAADWSATAPTGTVNLMPVSQARGVQTMNLVYMAPATLVGQTTVVVTLTVNGLSTSRAILFTVLDVPPTIVLSTNAIIVDEEFTDFFIAATATDPGFSGTLPIAVRASHDQRVMNISTTANGFQFSGANNYFGVVTLTVQTTDTIGQIGTANVVVTIQPTPDTPTISVTTNNITVINGSAPISIGVTTGDVDHVATPLPFTVQASTSGLVSITTAANTITLNAIPGVTGQTTLTVRTIDGTGRTATEIIVVNVVIILSGNAPTLVTSTSLIYVQEDFSTPVSIQVDGRDSDNQIVTLSLSSSSYLVNAVIASPTTGRGRVDSTITLTSVSDLSGTATLTVIVTDEGGRSDTRETVVVVTPATEANPLSFTLSTSAITLSAIGNQLNRNIQSINIRNPGDLNLRTQFTVTSSGTAIFSTNPAPVVSFTPNALTTSMMLSSPMHTAQLYFSIAPNQTGTATLTIQLDDLDRRESTQQTVVVSVHTANVAPMLTRSDQGLQNLVVHGGRLYANSMISTTSVNPFLAEASALGGHLINLNTVEELNFIRSSSLTSQNAWFGLILRQLEFPGQLSWETNDSTIGYGFARGNDSSLLTVYPGHFALNWGPTGLFANRGSTQPSVFNAANYSKTLNAFFLLGDRGDATPRTGLYEFPQGLPHAADIGLPLFAGSSVTIRITGIVLTGEAITRAHWSASVSTGTAIINTVYQSAGVQTVDLVYTAPADFAGIVPLLISLQVNGSVTTSAVGFNISIRPKFSVNVAGIKTLDFSWSAIQGATSFLLESNPDGNSGFTNLNLLSTTGIVITPNSTNIAQQTAQGVVALHRYIPNVTNPQFGVRTCFQATCEASMRHNTVIVTNSTLNDMISRIQRANTTGVGTANDAFGQSLDLSGDGNSFIVGANLYDAPNLTNNGGAAYVFTRNGSTWAQQAFLQVPSVFHSSNDNFGVSVSINANGDTVAVGATGDDGVASVDSVNEGAVYIFERNGSAWTYVTDLRASNRQVGDEFGSSVSLSDDGNTLAVGAPFEDDGNTDSGAAYIFTRTAGSTTSTWVQQAFLKPSSTFNANANFGAAVALSGDGNTLAVGAPFWLSKIGKVDTFRRSGTSWSSFLNFPSRVNSASGDHFGSSVSLDANGDILAVGAPNKDTAAGVAYVYHIVFGRHWDIHTTFRASNAESGDQFGTSVSLSADGNLLAVGAIGEDGSSNGVGGVKNNTLNSSGAVYMFEFGTAWVERAYVKAKNPAGSQFFGRASSLSSDGNTLLVGPSSNAVYLY